MKIPHAALVAEIADRLAPIEPSRSGRQHDILGFRAEKELCPGQRISSVKTRAILEMLADASELREHLQIILFQGTQDFELTNFEVSRQLLKTALGTVKAARTEDTHHTEDSMSLHP